MFDDIYSSLQAPASGVSPQSWDGSYVNQSALQQLLAQTQAGQDGRKVLGGNLLLPALNTLQGLKQDITPERRAYWDAPETNFTRNSDGDVVSGGQRAAIEDSALYSDGLGRNYRPTGKDAQGNALVQFTDNSGGGWENPTSGGGRDRVQPTYRMNADGSATPIAAGGFYKPSAWVDYGRDIAKLGAVMGTAAVGGSLLAGAGGGGAGAAGAGAAGGSAGLSSAEAAALYGAEGYGATGGAAAVAGSGGLSSAEAAALYGAEGYGAGGGAAASAAGGGGAAAGAGGGATAAGGGSGSGFFSSLASGDFGGAASAAGSYLSSPGGMGTAAQLVGGLLQSSAAKKAAEAQVESARSSNELLKGIYQQTRQDNMPALEARNAGLSGYQGLIKNPGSVQNDPGYAFGRDQGIQGIDRSAAGRGGLYSGATLKAQTKFGNDYATTKFDNALGRYGNLAQLGGTGTQTIANSANSYGQQAANNITGAGNASASGTVGSANAWGNALGSAYNGYMQNNLINSLIKQNGG